MQEGRSSKTSTNRIKTSGHPPYFFFSGGVPVEKRMLGPKTGLKILHSSDCGRPAKCRPNEERGGPAGAAAGAAVHGPGGSGAGCPGAAFAAFVKPSGSSVRLGWFGEIGHRCPIFGWLGWKIEGFRFLVYLVV